MNTARNMNEFTTPSWFAAMQEHCGIDTGLPLFVMGMPRSGTSLMEQILSRHPSIHAMGENANVYMRLFTPGAMFNPEAPAHLSQVTGGQFRSAGMKYLDVIGRSLPEGKTLASTKQPGMHFYGLIVASLYRQSKIISIERDPLDNAIGMFRRFLSPYAYPYSLNLVRSAEAIAAMRLYIKKWEELMPEKMMRVSLEKLSADPDAYLPDMQVFLGLDPRPTEELISVRQGERAVKTFSVNQVKQGLRNPRSAWMSAYRDILPAYITDRMAAYLPDM